MASEEKVGTIIGYYARIGVAVLDLADGDLRIGDQIRVHGETTDFTQTVESLEVEHQPMEQAQRGTQVALKVRERVRRRDQVSRIREG